MIKKLILPCLAIVIGFIAGMAFEFNQASDRFERLEIAAAAFLTSNAHSNFQYQMRVYNELEQHLKEGNVSRATQLLIEQKELMAYMIESAESFCEREKCTAETKAYFEQAIKTSNK